MQPESRAKYIPNPINHNPTKATRWVYVYFIVKSSIVITK